MWKHTSTGSVSKIQGLGCRVQTEGSRNQQSRRLTTPHTFTILYQNLYPRGPVPLVQGLQSFGGQELGLKVMLCGGFRLQGFNFVAPRLVGLRNLVFRFRVPSSAVCNMYMKVGFSCSAYDSCGLLSVCWLCVCIYVVCSYSRMYV